MSSKAQAKAAIYSALASAPVFHPSTVNLFSDWTHQSGDVISVSSDSTSYNVPISSMKISWNGSTRVNATATGNAKRDPIETLSERANQRSLYKNGSRYGKIKSEVEDVHSELIQTDSLIRAAVWSANSMIYSYIEQTATSITSRVENINEDLHSEIIQTQSMIRSAVWTANSMVYSYVDQTASYILDHVGERSGSKVIPSMTPPEDSPDNPLNVGDLWVEGTMINYWEDFDDQTPWIDYDPTHPEYDWSQLKGQKLYIWKNGQWQLVHDETTVAEDTDLVRTKDSISLIAYNTKYLNDEFKSNVARLDVKADKISSEVKEQVNGVNSKITQTATQIRAEVNASKSNLYSYIEQTATYITSVVADVENGLSSQILQTASQIRLEVRNSISGVQSSITQTASQIRSEVNAANSTIYSSITQTASSIRQEVANTESSLRGSITVESNRISLVVEGTGSNAKIKPAAIVSSINDGASSIVISANHINLDGYVKATDITADLITTKLALASNVNAKKLTLTNNGYIVLPSGDGSISITGSNASDIIRGLKVVSSGNGYKLQAITYGDSSWHDLPNSSFSRAVSSWIWGGGNGKINVTALPQNQTKSVSVSIDGQNTITSNGTYTYTVDYENSDGDDVSTGATKTVTVSNPYQPTALTQSVKDAGSVSGYTKHGSDYQTFYYNGSSGSRNIRVYTYPTITIDGVSRNLNDYSLSDYLSGSPTAVYDFGYSEGRGSVSYIPTALVQYGKDMGTVSDWTKGGSSGSIFYYNGSSGNRSVRIYAYPVITIDGVSRNLNDYDLSDFLGASPTAVYEFGYDEGHENGILDYRSNTSGWWKKPQDNSGVCTIPNDTNSGSETWFSMSPMGLTRVKTYVDTSGNASYYGKLYYYNAKESRYEYASDSDRYYYISNSNRAGTTTVYY